MWKSTQIVGVCMRSRDTTGDNSYRARNGREYLGVFGSMTQAMTALSNAGMEIQTVKDEDAEIALFRTVYPLFRGWRPTDYLTHEAAMSEPRTATLRTFPAAYHFWIRINRTGRATVLFGVVLGTLGEAEVTYPADCIAQCYFAAFRCLRIARWGAPDMREDAESRQGLVEPTP